MCICEKCSCRTDCEFYDESVKPVLTAYEKNAAYGEVEDEVKPYINKLEEALTIYTCSYFEEE